jgi:hypothetical protein
VVRLRSQTHINGSKGGEQPTAWLWAVGKKKKQTSMFAIFSKSGVHATRRYETTTGKKA